MEGIAKGWVDNRQGFNLLVNVTKKCAYGINAVSKATKVMVHGHVRAGLIRKVVKLGLKFTHDVHDTGSLKREQLLKCYIENFIPLCNSNEGS